MKMRARRRGRLGRRLLDSTSCFFVVAVVVVVVVGCELEIGAEKINTTEMILCRRLFLTITKYCYECYIK